MAVCSFDGSFRAANGQDYGRVLIETDGTRYRMIVADQRNALHVRRPPNK